MNAATANEVPYYQMISWQIEEYLRNRWGTDRINILNLGDEAGLISTSSGKSTLLLANLTQVDISKLEAGALAELDLGIERYELVAAVFSLSSHDNGCKKLMFQKVRQALAPKNSEFILGCRDESLASIEEQKEWLRTSEFKEVRTLSQKDQTALVIASL